VEAGNEWIVDADLKDFFGSVDHEKLLTLVGKPIADGRVLKLIQQMLEAGYEERGQKFATPRGTPQGGVVSPLLSNILLTPFDQEMRRQGYKLTRWADDWVVTRRTRAEAEHALARAVKILEQLGVALNQAKTRIVHITRGFEFLGFKIQRGKGKFRLTHDRIKRGKNILPNGCARSSSWSASSRSYPLFRSRKPFHESRIRENCTSGLCGGRRQGLH
jgi:RNA-directed DNA polymerase